MNYKGFIFVGTLCLSFICQGDALAKMVSTKGDEINMRSGPGTNYAVLYKLGAGMPLDVVKQSGEWLNVRDYEGDSGWVHKVTVNSAPHVIVKVSKNSTTQINVRSGPGTGNRIVAKAYGGVVFKVLEKKGKWVHVEHQEGTKGWIHDDLLWGF